MRVTHPFHPLAGREFDLLQRKHTWAEDRVLFLGEEGRLWSLPTGWTDAAPLDPFVTVAAGRSALRVDDLLDLAGLIAGLQPDQQAEGVKPTLPEV